MLHGIAARRSKAIPANGRFLARQRHNERRARSERGAKLKAKDAGRGSLT